jgi:recombination protein RecA
MAPPFRVAEVDIIYGKGISRESSLFELAVKYEILEKSGSFFRYNGANLAQGKDAVKLKLEQDKALYDEIEQKVKAAMSASNGLMDEIDDSEQESLE